MSRRLLLSLALVAIAASAASAQRGPQPECTTSSPLAPVSELREASGLALSRGTPKRLFSINDSSRPEIVVLGLDGSPKGKIALAGAAVIDWEDVTTAPCGDGNCLYVSDIGDNNAARRSIVLYRVAEPRDGEQQATPVRFEAVFPDGPHDAEAVFAGPGGRLYLMTKEPRGTTIYAFPERLDADAPNRLQQQARLDAGQRRDALSRVTDAESSEDGRLVAVRSNDMLMLVQTAALLTGRTSDARTFSLRGLGEPQGEGVAIGANGEVFLAGEGGARRGVGTFARLICARP